jgi:hypothetical protein
MATSIYTFNGQGINLLEINKISTVGTKLVNDKIVYYFLITLSGEQITSENFSSNSTATTSRNAIIAATNSALLDGGGGGSTTFFELTDTPSDYTGHKQKYVKVNEAEDGLEFVSGTGGAITFGDVSGDPYDNTNLTAALNDKENLSNKVTSFQATPDNIKYPTEKLVKDSLDGKEPTQTKGSISEAASSVLTITNGSNATVGPNTTIQVKQANTTESGFLSNTDWNTFNGKQDELVSGTNIKTINSTTLLESGNIDTPNTTYTAGDGLSLAGTQFSNSDKGTSAVSTHESSFTHSDIAHTNRVALDNVSGTNTGDQSSSDFDIKDLTDSTSLRSTWNNKQNQLTIRTEADRFTLSATDKDKYIRYTGAGNITVTVPDTLATNDVVTIRQAGDGVITLDEDAGVTLNGELKSAGIHSTLQIIKIDDGEYDVIGGVSY